MRAAALYLHCEMEAQSPKLTLAACFSGKPSVSSSKCNKEWISSVPLTGSRCSLVVDRLLRGVAVSVRSFEWTRNKCGLRDAVDIIISNADFVERPHYLYKINFGLESSSHTGSWTKEPDAE